MKKTISGDFTLQRIEQLVERGDKVIELPYYVIYNPSMDWDRALGFTQNPFIIIDENEKDISSFDSILKCFIEDDLTEVVGENQILLETNPHEISDDMVDELTFCIHEQRLLKKKKK